MKTILRLAGFTLGYSFAVLLERVVISVERDSRAYALAEAEAATVVPFTPRQRCLCSVCERERARA